MVKTQMLHYYIWTIGCQMNIAESDRLRRILESRDFGAADTAEDADLIVLNSCVVRESAEDRIRNKLHIMKRLKNQYPEKVLAVTGCLVDSPSALKQSFPFVDHFFPPGDNPSWLETLPTSRLTLSPSSPTAYVPIIRGCDNFCTYCIVPYRRGREKSRPVSEIISEVDGMVRRGVREVTLLGQNVDSYGHDLPGQPDLAGLLSELNRMDGLARIRFLTNHPKDISPRLIAALAFLDKVCEQLSLPVQAGSDDILRLMRRGYTVAQYRDLVSQIRSRVPEIALSTDVILGFPGETEGQFQETVDLLSELSFATVHVAAYSPRPGTVAAREYEDNVPLAEKQRRLRIVEQLQETIATKINASLLGKTVEILVEGNTRDKWQGRTRGGALVFFTDPEDRTGQLVNLRITRTGPWSLQGEPVTQERKEKITC